MKARVAAVPAEARHDREAARPRRTGNGICLLLALMPFDVIRPPGGEPPAGSRSGSGLMRMQREWDRVPGGKTLTCPMLMG